METLKNIAHNRINSYNLEQKSRKIQRWMHVMFELPECNFNFSVLDSYGFNYNYAVNNVCPQREISENIKCNNRINTIPAPLWMMLNIKTFDDCSLIEHANIIPIDISMRWLYCKFRWHFLKFSELCFEQRFPAINKQLCHGLLERMKIYRRNIKMNATDAITRKIRERKH